MLKTGHWSRFCLSTCLVVMFVCMSAKLYACVCLVSDRLDVQQQRQLLLLLLLLACSSACVCVHSRTQARFASSFGCVCALSMLVRGVSISLRDFMFYERVSASQLSLFCTARLALRAPLWRARRCDEVAAGVGRNNNSNNDNDNANNKGAAVGKLHNCNAGVIKRPAGRTSGRARVFALSRAPLEAHF